MSQPPVLIVDDDPFMLDVLQETLAMLGNTNVRTSLSAQAALEIIDWDDPELLVFCDLYMPEMDGVEFIRILSQRGFSGAVALVSGEEERTVAMVERVVRGHKLRFLGVLHKPVDQDTFRAVLARAQPQPPESRSGSRLAQPVLTPEALRAGLAGDALYPVFQPKVDIASGALHGFEVLARWSDPQGAAIPPSVFVPLAEQLGCVDTLTESIILQSLAQWSKWHALGFTAQIAVNLSMRTLARLDFPDWLAQSMTRFAMPTEYLMLELTESSAMQGVTDSFDVLARLCLKRFQLSIDDFGTAYSNLEKLHMLPFRELKIDQIFVRGGASSALNRAILGTSAALGRELGMTVVAEGVETVEEWELVKRVGCDVVQGYYVSRPLHADQVMDWAHAWRERTR